MKEITIYIICTYIHIRIYVCMYTYMHTHVHSNPVVNDKAAAHEQYMEYHAARQNKIIEKYNDFKYSALSRL